MAKLYSTKIILSNNEEIVIEGTIIKKYKDVGNFIYVLRHEDGGIIIIDDTAVSSYGVGHLTKKPLKVETDALEGYTIEDNEELVVMKFNKIKIEK